LDPLNSDILLLRREHWEEMNLFVTAASPEEACGLIGGKDQTSMVVYPILNELHSPIRFRLDPQLQLDAFVDIEQRGLDLLVIYHSHPKGPQKPSQTDIEEFAYPGVLSLIWFPDHLTWKCRCFEIKGPNFREVKVRLIP
jgi:proteasome lid subunit RPN8/RPN11